MLRRFLVHYKQTLLLAYPVVISQLGHVLVSVADSLMVGHLGSIPLAACSLGISIFAVFMVLGIGISYGLTPLVAQESGKKNASAIAAIYKNGLFVNLLIGAILSVVIYFSTLLLPYLKQDAEVVKQTIPFLRVLGISMLPFMIFLGFKQFAEGLAYTKIAMVISIVANVLNVGLNYALINGHWGSAGLGLTGAGIANFTARSVMALAMGYYVLTSSHFTEYVQLSKKLAITKAYCLKVLKIGIPVGMQYIFEIGAFSGAVILIGQMGANALAAHQVAINLASITYMMASGIAAAATVRVGNAFGRKNYSELRIAGFSAYHLIVVFMGICALLFITQRASLALLYIQDIEVVTIATSLVFIAGLFQLSDGVQVIGLGALRGIGDVKLPTLFTFLAYWVIGLPVGYYMATTFHLGPQGIWYGLLIGLSIAAVALLWRFHYLSKKMKAYF